ncbi:MAG: BrnA antitoxin family protein [Alphaproteobacteria bacterium]|nr:BrnA antitoxin family protein [Alphaproteobacteria bacterium]
MKSTSARPLSRKQQSELKRVSRMADEDIDRADIPEVTDWSGARRGAFFRPVKEQLTLRIDADVLAWFRSRSAHGRGYQTAINEALRQYVRRHATRRKAS